jgi:hypothetical protein
LLGARSAAGVAGGFDVGAQVTNRRQPLRVAQSMWIRLGWSACRASLRCSRVAECDVDLLAATED